MLISSSNAIFPRDAYARATSHPRRGRRLSDRFPWRSVNLAKPHVFRRFAELVTRSAPTFILVIGSGDQRAGLDALFARSPGVVIVYTDVDIHASVDVFCDGHQLPFQDAVFHGVVTSAVLEHVLYPERVIGEIHRVLGEGGLVYSEVPFMQQVHEGAYDFTRYTLSGHRRVFNRFQEIDSGVVAGPGTTLLWAIEHFLRCFAPRPWIARATAFGVRTALFWVKYFDYLVRRSAAAVDGASCTYFLGRKEAGFEASDASIIDRYAGSQRLRHV